MCHTHARPPTCRRQLAARVCRRQVAAKRAMSTCHTCAWRGGCRRRPARSCAGRRMVCGTRTAPFAQRVRRRGPGIIVEMMKGQTGVREVLLGASYSAPPASGSVVGRQCGRGLVPPLSCHWGANRQVAPQQHKWPPARVHSPDCSTRREALRHIPLPHHRRPCSRFLPTGWPTCYCCPPAFAGRESQERGLRPTHPQPRPRRAAPCNHCQRVEPALHQHTARSRRARAARRSWRTSPLPCPRNRPTISRLVVCVCPGAGGPQEGGAAGGAGIRGRIGVTRKSLACRQLPRRWL